MKEEHEHPCGGWGAVPVHPHRRRKRARAAIAGFREVRRRRCDDSRACEAGTRASSPPGKIRPSAHIPAGVPKGSSSTIELGDVRRSSCCAAFQAHYPPEAPEGEDGQACAFRGDNALDGVGRCHYDSTVFCHDRSYCINHLRQRFFERAQPLIGSLASRTDRKIRAESGSSGFARFHDRRPAGRRRNHRRSGHLICASPAASTRPLRSLTFSADASDYAARFNRSRLQSQASARDDGSRTGLVGRKCIG